MFLNQISVSAHSVALAYRIRLRGTEHGTPLPFNLKMSGCRQHRFSPVGDRSGANLRAHCGPSFEVASPPSVLLHVEQMDLPIWITSVELDEKDFRGVEKTSVVLPAGSRIEWTWNGERMLTDGIDPEVDDLDNGPTTSRSARWIRSWTRMPGSTRTSRVGGPVPLSRSGHG